MRSSIRIGGIAWRFARAWDLPPRRTIRRHDQKQQPSGPPAAEQKPVPSPRLPTQPPGQEADNAKPTMLQPEHSATPDKVGGAGARRDAADRAFDHLGRERRAWTSCRSSPCSFRSPPSRRARSPRASARRRSLPVGTIQVTVAQSLPTDVMLQEFPADATAAVPDMARYKYVKLSDRVLIVDPPFWTVVGEIKK